MDSKGKLILIGVIVLAIVLGILCYIDFRRPANVELTTHEVTIEYGEELPDDAYSIREVSKIFRRKKDIPHSLDYVSYDKELVGTQEATLTYKGHKSVFSLTILPQKLAAPARITYAGGWLDWEDVANASGYVVSVNGVPKFQTAASECGVDTVKESGILSVTIKAVSGSEKYTESDFSAPLELNKLAPAENIAYENGALTWNRVAGAEGYNVWINGEKHETVTNTYSFSSFIPGDNTIAVQAYGSGNIIAGERQEKTFHKLYPVSNIRYADGRISWDSENANCRYKVEINGTVYTTNQTYLDKSLQLNQRVTVKVTALANDGVVSIDSEPVTQEIVYRRLAAPGVAIMPGDYANTYNIVVTGVENADMYSVSVVLWTGSSSDVTRFTLTDTLTRQVPVGRDVDKIEVYVKAMHSEGKFADSEEVKAEITI